MACSTCGSQGSAGGLPNSLMSAPAKNVRPARHGDLYWYEVDKYWIVESVSEGGLVLRTARGKSHVVPADDPNLRKPSLKEWLWLHLLARERLVQLRGQCAGSELGRSGQP